MSQPASSFLPAAIDAARQAGALIKANYGTDLDVNETLQYDLKLELDVRSQELITGILLAAFPGHAIYGEEGLAGDQSSEYHWIVDPIDGTVNYFYGIPHFCVSIALRKGPDLLIGVIYDPMMDELFLAEQGALPTLNGKPIHVSKRANLADAMITVGFSKNKESIDAGMRRFAGNNKAEIAATRTCTRERAIGKRGRFISQRGNFALCKPRDERRRGRRTCFLVAVDQYVIA